MSQEVRATSPTGGQKGTKVERLGGADPLALEELARVFGYGEAKYARYNYLRGYPWSQSVDALYRHFLAFQARQDRDAESGLLHMAHVAWHALAIVGWQLRGITGPDGSFDDRAPALTPAAPSPSPGPSDPLPYSTAPQMPRHHKCDIFCCKRFSTQPQP